jgi:hypothetical protein
MRWVVYTLPHIVLGHFVQYLQPIHLDVFFQLLSEQGLPRGVRIKLRPFLDKLVRSSLYRKSAPSQLGA